VAENLANKLIGLLVTLAILAAVYFFFVKPVLDTTNDAFDSINGTVDNAFDDFGVDGFDVDDIVNGNLGDVQQQIREANLDNDQQKQAELLVACIRRVQPNTNKMQACVEKFQ